MLDKLIESKNGADEKKRTAAFLMSTFSGVALALLTAVTYSLFAQALEMNSDGLNVSELTAPVVVTEQTSPSIEQEKMAQTGSASGKILFSPQRENTKRIETSQSIVPSGVSVVKNNFAARDNGSGFIINSDHLEESAYSPAAGGRNDFGGGQKLADSGIKNQIPEKMEIDKPPIIQQKPESNEKTVRKMPISTGVVNGKAVNLVKPIYSAAARQVQARGEVKVQVTIDEDGNVIAASVVSGHPLLKASALSAAKASKFSPTYLSREKVKVTGFILYNFNM